MPDWRAYALHVPAPGAVDGEATRQLGQMLRDVMKLNEDARNFRVMGPDETASNRLDALFEVTDRVFEGEILDSDELIRLGEEMAARKEQLGAG